MKTKHKGFSLIELLVVIAIIIVLASVAISLAGRARDSANSATSMNSLRQMGTSMAIVCVDNNNRLPFSFGGSGNYKDWVRRITSSEFGNSVPINDWKRLFINKQATAKEKYNPSDGKYGFLDSTPYGMNLYLDSTFGDVPSGLWSMMRLPDAGRTVVLADAWVNPSWKSAGSRFRYNKAPNGGEAISYRQPGSKAHLLFADWHVQAETRAEVLKNSHWFEPAP